jgi:hypothetical protein
MVNKDKIESMGFDSIEEYFDYILESRDNGQHAQAKELFAKLGRKQVKEFFDYVETTYYYDALDDGETSGMVELLRYFHDL